MADYHPLIARAVDGLGTSTGEARRALYERARSALVGQLRAIDPPLSEADITRERLALEDAIRKVEAETVRKTRTEPRPATPPLRSSPIAPRPQSSPPPPSMPPRRDRPSPPFGETPPTPRPDTRFETQRPAMQRTEPQRMDPPALRNPNEFAPNDPPRAAAPPSARDRILSARTSPVSREGIKDYRDFVGDTDDLGAASPQQFPYDDEPAARPGRAKPRFGTDESEVLDEDSPQLEDSEESYEDEQQAPSQQFARPHSPRGRDQEDHYEEPRPPRSYRGLAKLAVVLIILAGLTATISWQWSNITGLYDFILNMRSRPTQTTQAPPGTPKSDDRVPQQQAAGQAPSSGAPGQQPGPEVAQRVVLYEEDPNDPQGKRFVGSAIWRTDTVSPGSGLAPELEVRADITVPERNMTVTWTLRRNTDQALPASHTIEIMFNVPADFPGGGIANVPGVLMKDSEQARGIPLAGLAVKVTNGFFLIGLSAVDADVQRNIQLLKEKPWFDVPIVYNNGGRAILALEKGPPGDRAFGDAFAAWSK